MKNGTNTICFLGRHCILVYSINNLSFLNEISIKLKENSLKEGKNSKENSRRTTTSKNGNYAISLFMFDYLNSFIQ